MKAKAKHWVNYHGVWYRAGEKFEIDQADAEEMKQYAVIENDAEPEQSEPAKRGRKRKAE